jgi:hypothetical protein
MYYVASSYTEEPLAERTYSAVSALLKRHKSVELSAYRYVEQLPTLHMVVMVVGLKPEEHIHQELVQALKTGHPIAINARALLFLAQRHIEKAQEAPWVEKRNQHTYVYLNRTQRRKRKH